MKKGVSTEPREETNESTKPHNTDIVRSSCPCGDDDYSGKGRSSPWLGLGGVGAGIAAAVILGSIYHHRHHRYYGYPYGYYGEPYYGYGYYRPYRHYGYYRPPTTIITGMVSRGWHRWR